MPHDKYAGLYPGEIKCFQTRNLKISTLLKYVFGTWHFVWVFMKFNEVREYETGWACILFICDLFTDAVSNSNYITQ